MSKSKKDKKETSMIEDTTGISSEYIWIILVILFIIIVIGCLYYFEIWPFNSVDEIISQNVDTTPEPLPELKNVLSPPPPVEAQFQTPEAQFQTPPTIPSDPILAQDMPKVTGGGIQIFKKR